MSKYIIKQIIFILVILIYGCISMFAQEKCDVKFDVYEFREKDSPENFPVNDYKVKLIYAETKKTVKTNKIGEKVVVENISEGSYIATFSKNGFQKTEDKIFLDCSLADAQNTVSEIVFLWKGDSRKTFKTYSDLPAGTQIGVYQKDLDSNSGVLNSGAVILGRPTYPIAARVVRASGKVEVQVLINELGNVVSAKAVSGHPLLQSAAVEAAKKSKFRMTLLSGIPVNVNGIIVYNFVP